MPNPWVTGHIIQPQYLNSVQELLSDWADNVLLQASQAAVVVPANASAPAELSVEGYLKTNTDEVVADLTGSPSAVYNIYATANRADAGWEMEATPTQAVAAHIRKIGEADFDGADVTEVRSEIREINVSHLQGHQSSEVPAPQAIPAGTATATLDPGWLDDPTINMMPVGGIREAWVPSGVAYDIPEGWVELNGQVVAAASHSFQGVATFTTPDMRNKLSLGAASTNIYGTPGNDSGVAPGLNGQSGTNTARAWDHTHGGGGHSHSINSHLHDASHRHWFKSHRHIYRKQQRKWQLVGTVTSTLISNNPESWGTQRRVFIGGIGTPSPPGPVEYPGTPSYVVSNQTVYNTGLQSGLTSGIISGGGMASAGVAAVDINPQTVGLSHFLRVM